MKDLKQKPIDVPVISDWEITLIDNESCERWTMTVTAPTMDDAIDKAVSHASLSDRTRNWEVLSAEEI